MNTNKLVSISFALGLAASAGCGTDVTATASGVFPAQGFTGRSLRVEVSGDQTKWKDGATVSFGDGVTVNKVEVASPTDLFADITVDPAAMAGMRDVTVTSGGSFKLTQAFELVAPVELSILGNAGQGGLPNFTLVNHDFDNPFDLTQDPATGGYANLLLTGPTGVQLIINTATEYTISGQSFIDLDATAGALTLASGTGNATVTSNLGSFPVMPRTPTAITGPTTGMITMAGDSSLYSVTATGAPSLVHLTLSSSDPNAAPGAAIFTDNSWNHAVGTHLISDAGGTFTFVVADLGGTPPYNYSVNAVGQMLTSAAEGNDTANGKTATAPTASALPYRQTGGTISAKGDVDIVAVTITGSNKVLHVVTDAGLDPNTDTAVDITDAAGTTSYLQAYGGGPVDGSECSFFGCTNLGEDVLSDPLAAGTYYVTITAGAQFTSNDAAYTAAFWIE